MAGMSDQEIDRNRCILMYDDETVADAVAALRDAQGQEWWHLVVDTGGGGYASAAYSSLTEPLRTEGGHFLSRRLGDLAGGLLPRVEIVANMNDDPVAVKEKTSETASSVAVILKDGEFRGILAAGATRGGLFGSELVGLAGQYAELPRKGLIGSRRRQEATARKAPRVG